MKQILLALLIIGLASCSKENISAPSSAAATSSAISFSSDNIAIHNFKAQATSNEVTVGFSTVFQKDVKTLEILRGTTPTGLCSIYKTDGTSTSNTAIQYSTEDQPTAATLYYIVKYTLQDGDWGYTPVFTLQTGK